MLNVLEGTDQQRVQFLAFKLTREAKRWIFERAIREVVGTGIVSWLLFKQTFLDRFFPRSVKNTRAQEFTNLI